MLKLSRVELIGFKSFAEPQEIGFERPITSIVGPNGGGKSNILDAVLFAFGEQSPTRLRTRRMDDLIFGGAGDRKKQNFTGVVLEFVTEFQGELKFRVRPSLPGAGGDDLLAGNGDGAGGNGRKGLAIECPVTLERRLYRDGQSEYLINGEPVRLRDVDEFFGRFSLGRGAILAITQGEVEKKILANPEEMRGWFVSACGIGQLIARKEKTEARLLEVSRNLDRLSEIVSGTRERVLDLAVEREEALKYHNINQRLSVLRRESLRRELADCFKSLESGSETIAEVKERLFGLRRDSDDRESILEEAVEKLGDSMRDVEGRLLELSEANRALEGVKAGISKAEVETKMLDGALISLSKRRDETAGALDDDERRSAAIAKELREVEEGLKSLRDAVSKFEGELEEVHGERDSAESASEDAADLLFETERYVLDLRNRLETARGSAMQVNAALSRRLAELEGSDARLVSIEAEIAGIKETRGALEKSGLEGESESEEAIERLEECKENLAGAEEERERVREELAAVDARRESLALLEREAEGFPAGKRALLTDDKLKGKIGSASDIWGGLEFPAEIEGAVSLVLFGFEDAVEVGDLPAGCEVLREFHGSGVGRLRIIGQSERRAVPARPVWWPSGVDRFFELVESDDGRLGLMFGEVGEVAVCDSLDEAREMIALHPELGFAVLRDGSVMVGRGEAVGGAPSQGSRVLSRRREIDNLSREANRLRVNWAAVSAGVDEARDALERAGNEIQEGAERRAEHLRDLAVSEEKLEMLVSRREEITLTVGTAKLEIGELAREVKGIEAELLARYDELVESKAKLKECESKASSLASELDKRNKEFSSVESRQNLALEKLKVGELKLNYVSEQRDEIERRTSELLRKVEELGIEKTEAHNEMKALEIRLGELKVELTLREQESSLAEFRLTEARERVAGREKDMEGARAAARGMDDSVSVFERDLARLEVGRGRLLYRYFDLWKRWREEDAAGTSREIEREDELVSPETLRLVKEALLLSRAWAESEGIELSSDPADEQEECGETPHPPVEAGQMALEDAAEITISGWEEGEIPAPPSQPRAVEGPEKIGRARLKDAITNAEAELAGLGEVNHKAPQSWVEESARLKFFLSEEIELTDALLKLEGLLQRLDRKTLGKYEQQTEKIEKRFKEYFKFLFGSGDVCIKFTEPEDILASGVEVLVTLPGERRQALRALSGGERSLVFLALFLAAHSVGECGICILDEADAALDDANILRLGRLLDSIASSTQFVIITHNKRTMELSDGLVGVVHRPKGVSRVIPVNLDAAREYAEAKAG